MSNSFLFFTNSVNSIKFGWVHSAAIRSASFFEGFSNHKITKQILYPLHTHLWWAFFANKWTTQFLTFLYWMVEIWLNVRLIWGPGMVQVIDWSQDLYFHLYRYIMVSISFWTDGSFVAMWRLYHREEGEEREDDCDGTQSRPCIHIVVELVW